jgi:hypothetical protein
MAGSLDALSNLAISSGHIRDRESRHIDARRISSKTALIGYVHTTNSSLQMLNLRAGRLTLQLGVFLVAILSFMEKALVQLLQSSDQQPQWRADDT